MLFWLNFGILLDFAKLIKFYQANLYVWFSQFLKAFWVAYEEINCPMLTTTEKSKKRSLNSRKLLKTEKLRVSWEIQNAIKSDWKEELGWNFQDLLLSMIPTNGQNLKQIGEYQFQILDQVDWTDTKFGEDPFEKQSTKIITKSLFL